MGSNDGAPSKPHVVLVPFPSQGHINPMLNFAKLLHANAVHVTFVLTDYNRTRLLRSRGPHALDGLPSFRFASFPDGLPPSDANVTQDVAALCESLDRNGVGALTEVLVGLNESGPPIECIVGDLVMPFTLEVAEALGIREVMFWSASACAFVGYDQIPRLLREGYVPLKDVTHLTNGYLDTPLDWIPPMKGIRLNDIPTFIRTTDSQDILLNYAKTMFQKSRKASAIILNTFDELERDILAHLAPDSPPLFPVGPLHMLTKNLIPGVDETNSIGSNLWKEDQHCLEWLNSNKSPGSVVYVNFGSVTVMSNNQLVEFAFGLANSGKRFLWVIRPDLVDGESAVLPQEFVEETKERSLLVEWCDQERVLGHVAVGGFLTHCGWNSTIESVCAGVPMISWPFFADQQMNCWALWNLWGLGMEIDSDVRRDVVERQVKELMDGVKGKEMRKKAMEWKVKAEEAVEKGSGESWKNLEKLINEFLVSSID